MGSGHIGTPLGGAGGTGGSVGALVGWQMRGNWLRGVPAARSRLQYCSISAALGCALGAGVGTGTVPGMRPTRFGEIVATEYVNEGKRATLGGGRNGLHSGGNFAAGVLAAINALQRLASASLAAFDELAAAIRASASAPGA